jgi:NADH:ubiquinone reductase (H+-translocating)
MNAAELLHLHERKRIVILGAGFAGLYAALELERTVARDPGVEVLLIDPQNFLLFTPMLHEVASGSLDPSSIVVPIREALRRVEFLRAETTAVDFAGRTVTVAYGLDRRTRTIRFDQLLIAAGSQTRFSPSLRPHVHGMKTIHDALVLRNWLIGLLERADIEEDPARRRALLTIAVAGGGFSGVETIGAINDFLHEVARHYRKAAAESPTLVLLEPMDRLLPEFEPALGEYTALRLRAAGVDVRLRTKVAAFDGRTLSLESSSDSGKPSLLPTRTLIWTAGVAPSPLIEALPLQKERGRIVVDETTAVRGHEGVWACGDCAAVPGPQGKLCPPTAQHAMRQGMQAARNIAAAVRGEPAKIRPYRYEMLGQFAAIGRQRAVATLFGVRFSGFIAWLMWRGAYLLMLPRLERKVRVFLQWMLELCFARDTVQLLTAESVRSRRIDELLDSARGAESAEEVAQQ